MDFEISCSRTNIKVQYDNQVLFLARRAMPKGKHCSYFLENKLTTSRVQELECKSGLRPEP